ncbi:hypothetical protein VER_04395 [Veillonella sp. R32]|nr:hypothetical protein VER_04395 [Veillonella sp. R32]
MVKQVNIGITFFWGDSYNNIWSNGAGQNMYFLKEALEQIPWVKDVYFVYWDNDAEKAPKELELDAMNVKLYEYKEVVATTDLIIEGTLIVSREREREIHEHGGKLVTFRMGTDYMMDLEKFVYDLPGGRAFNGAQYDAIWTLPHHYATNQHYLEIMTNTKLHIAPYLWDPIFLDKVVTDYERDGDYPGFGYTPKSKSERAQENGKRLATFEPNISVIKACYTQILLAEAAYKKEPEAIKHIYLCNTVKRKDTKVFHDFIGWTKLLDDNKLSVEPRYITPYFLGKYTDIVLCHQWSLALNNLYMDVLYGNYPLIHNSPILKEHQVGFYYEGFDAYEGARALLDAVHTYDDDFEVHVARNKAFLQTLSPYNPTIIAEYEWLLKKALYEDNSLDWSQI